LEEGGFVQNTAGQNYWLEESLSAKLSEILHASQEQSASVLLSRAERKALLNQLLRYYQLHIDNFPTINSHEILEEVLN
ncbi:MAG: hypothetical protein KDC44_09945, partial [Phaeodactylibacter sp.]|nr:hypothetical protein [Phaeodactylibacter sp.]